MVVDGELAACTDDVGAVGGGCVSYCTWDLVMRYQREEVAYCTDFECMSRSG